MQNVLHVQIPQIDRFNFRDDKSLRSYHLSWLHYNRKLKIAFKNSNFLIIFSYLHFNQSVAVRRSVLMLFEKKKIIKVSETIFEQLYLTIRFSVY